MKKIIILMAVLLFATAAAGHETELQIVAGSITTKNLVIDGPPGTYTLGTSIKPDSEGIIVTYSESPVILTSGPKTITMHIFTDIRLVPDTYVIITHFFNIDEPQTPAPDVTVHELPPEPGDEPVTGCEGLAELIGENLRLQKELDEANQIIENFPYKTVKPPKDLSIPILYFLLIANFIIVFLCFYKLVKNGKKSQEKKIK